LSKSGGFQMSILFDSIEINGMTVPNRFMRSATNDRLAEVSGQVNDAFIHVYEELARGGVGLIVTGHAYVQWSGKASKDMLGGHTDDMIPGLKRLVDTVHQYDSKIVLQINHAGRQTSSQVIGQTPVAPSPVYYPVQDGTPREFTGEEIETLIEAYGAAAGRAVAAGFDGVQIHGAHGYGVSQFISPYTNRRQDKWGSSPENRMRFPIEVLHRMRKEVGDSYPVMIKLNSADFIEGGLTIEESAPIAAALSQEGIDAIEISGGMVGGAHITPIKILTEEDEACYRANAMKFREVIDVPLMLVAGLRSFGLMEKLVETGEVDMVSMCRPFIREPDLINKWKQGNLKRADCISCNGCLKYRDEPVRCIQLD
jgi:2,4-dienoyl-CoA reductase-like NADH-dependent reductase (Old Yellow Enzyme family)